MPQRLISQLELRWAQVKYEVLEKDPAVYQKIRTLLKDKVNPNATLMDELIQQALNQTADEGRQNNALQHVWGYFKKVVNDEEKAVFEKEYHLWLNHLYPLNQLKQNLYTLAVKYKLDYLIQSSYFNLKD